MAFLVTVGLLAVSLSPSLLRRVGILHHGVWFLDSHAVLAAADAVRAGIDPTQANPLDVLQRPHVYSDWWLLLARTPLGRDHNFLVGSLWTLAFLVVACATLRPRDLVEAVAYALLCLSPAVVFAICRGNNDLVVFALVGAGALAWSAAPRLGWVVSIAAIGIATGLKFYPAAAAGMLLLVRPAGRMFASIAISAVVLAAVLTNVGDDMTRALFPVPKTIHVFGATVLLNDMGWDGASARVGAFALLAVGAWASWRRGWTSGLSDDSAPLHRRVLFAAAACMLVGCFLAGTSYSYRCIFALWLAPWLLDEARQPSRTPRRRNSARVAMVLVFLLLWTDGVSALVTNLLIGPMPFDTLQRVQLACRFISQPFAWALMLMLGGWLLEIAVAAAALRRVKPQPAAKPAPAARTS